MPTTATVGVPCELYVRSPVKNFGLNQEAELIRYLTETENMTSTRPIAAADEVKLRDDGRTERHGYRFTSSCFRQLSSLLVPGLSKLLPDLAGMTSHTERASAINGHEARTFFNRIVELRFELLRPYQLVKNDRDRIFEGLVGHRHQNIPNSELVRHARDTLLTNTRTQRFHTALVAGRQLYIWLRDVHPCFTINSPHVGEIRFYSGYYLGNSEIRGTSFRGTSALFTKFGVCMAPYDRFGGRVAHIGRDFTTRLTRVFGEMMTKRPDPVELQEMASRLFDTRLDLYATDAKERKAKEMRIVRAVSELGIPQRLAIDVLTHAMYIGHTQSSIPSTIAVPQNVLATRSVFDLFVGALKVSRQLGSLRRESTEQVAYSLLTGRLQL